jgi:serine/threonine-protein kinase
LHYELIEKLGQGGMGVVWKARDTRLARLVALKLLPPDREDVAHARARLLREARAASALNHPNIVTVYDVLTSAGTDCIAMEYVEGETLDVLLRRDGLDLSRFFEIAIPLCDAVAKAHSAGIIHRDLKPSNVMVTADGVVKVLDFGLAKTLDAFALSSGQTSVNLTAAGVIMGTVSYMSPEQASGRPMDARSDVFALGIILYQMLTGINPFEAENTMSTLERVYTVQPDSVRTYRQGTPAALEWCVDKALRKKPEDRYASAGVLRDELRKIVTGVQATADNAPTQALTGALERTAPRLRRWWPAAAVILGLAGGAWVVRDRFAELPTRTRADEPVSGGPYELTQQAQSYLHYFSRPEYLDRAIQALNRAVQKDPKYAPAWAGLAEAYWIKYRESPDKVLLNTALGHAQKAVELNDDLAVGHIWLGAALVDSARRDEGMKEYHRALELDPKNADAYRLLGASLASAKEYEQAEASLRKAVELAPGDWRTHNSLAVFLYGRNRYDAAIREFERTRDLARDNPTVHKNLAAVYHMVGRDDDAAASLQRSLEIQETANAYTNLGTLRFYQGRFAEAAEAMQHAIRLDANKHVMWGNLADAYRWSPDKAVKAPAAYDRAIELVRQRLAVTPGDADLRSSLATYLVKQKRTEEALAEIRTALGGSSKKPDILFKAAIVFELGGRRDQAIRMLEDAVALGYPWKQIENDPELVSLRRDPRFHLLASKRFPHSAPR